MRERAGDRGLALREELHHRTVGEMRRDAVQADHRVGHAETRRMRDHELADGLRVFGRDVEPDVVQQADCVTGPSDRDHRRGQRVFEQQQRAHDPRAEFADGGVRVGVRGAGDRQHRGELGVAQARECADDAGDDEGEHDRGAGIQRGGGAGADEDAGADDATDAEQHQVNRAERAFELAAIELGLDLSNGLGTPTHRAPRIFVMAGL